MRSVLHRVLKPYKDTPHGRSAGTRTPGLLLPKQARYQLRNTPMFGFYFSGGLSRRRSVNFPGTWAVSHTVPGL